MNATEVLAEAATVGYAVGSALVVAVASAVESLFVSCVWKPIFEVTRKFYMTAPHWLGGCEGRPIEDICANLLGVPSTILFSDLGQRMCNEKVDNKIAGLSIAILYIVGAGILFNVYHYAKTNIAARSKAKTRVAASDQHQLVSWSRFAKLRFRYAASRYAAKAAAKILGSYMPMSEKIRALQVLFLPASEGRGQGRGRNGGDVRHRQLMLPAGGNDDGDDEDDDDDEDFEDDDDDGDDDEADNDDADEDEDDDDDDDDDDEGPAAVSVQANAARATARRVQPPPLAASGRGTVRRQPSRRCK